MYIVTLENHPDGVYSVFDEVEERVIPIFEEEDDADRYLMMLEEGEDYPPMQIVETLVDADNIEDADLETKDTMTLLNEYIDEVEIAVDKTELKSLMRTLYIESCNVV